MTIKVGNLDHLQLAAAGVGRRAQPGDVFFQNLAILVVGVLGGQRDDRAGPREAGHVIDMTVRVSSFVQQGSP